MSEAKKEKMQKINLIQWPEMDIKSLSLEMGITKKQSSEEFLSIFFPCINILYFLLRIISEFILLIWTFQLKKEL